MSAASSTLLIVRAADQPMELLPVLERSGYTFLHAYDENALFEQLGAHDDIAAIIVDLEHMPASLGSRMLFQLQRIVKYSPIPILFLADRADQKRVHAALGMGGQYLIPPLENEKLCLQVVHSAIESGAVRKALQQEMRNMTPPDNFSYEAAYYPFRTLEEARYIACMIANYFPNPEAAAYGLSELMINAVEHGNLGIGYNEKTRLLFSGTWQEEVNARLEQAEHCSKRAMLTFKRLPTEISVSIRDEGSGFDWHDYLEMSPERAAHPHGRGIATAMASGFGDIHYVGSGNEVVCKVELVRRAA